MDDETGRAVVERLEAIEKRLERIEKNEFLLRPFQWTFLGSLVGCLLALFVAGMVLAGLNSF